MTSISKFLRYLINLIEGNSTMDTTITDTTTVTTATALAAVSATDTTAETTRTISDVESDLTGAQVAHEAAKTALDAATLAKTEAEKQISGLVAEYRSLLTAAQTKLAGIEADISGGVQTVEAAVSDAVQTVEQGAVSAVQAVENLVTGATS